MSQRKNFQLSVLPPTQEAAHYHSLRVYYQIKQWTNSSHNFNVEEWGWTKTKNGLLPVTTKAKAVPDSVAKIIACKCSKGCSGNCSCKKNGIFCTNLCVNCLGKNCGNGEQTKINMDDENYGDDTNDEPEELAAQLIDIPNDLGENDAFMEVEPVEPGDDCLFADIYDGTDSEAESDVSITSKRSSNQEENDVPNTRKRTRNK